MLVHFDFLGLGFGIMFYGWDKESWVGEGKGRGSSQPAWAPAAQSLAQKWIKSGAMKLVIWCAEMPGSFKHNRPWIWTELVGLSEKRLAPVVVNVVFRWLGIFICGMHSFQANPFNFKHLFVCFDAPRFVPATLFAIICWRVDPCSVIPHYDVSWRLFIIYQYEEVWK